ncbi:Demethylrebeccamycin-D-glucose O-methyltransferase [Anaerolineae bacterium]|nr:Demethylrebeccamycin-D-glucose O-methyltransferase [Anaerolineae bacterium]
MTSVRTLGPLINGTSLNHPVNAYLISITMQQKQQPSGYVDSHYLDNANAFLRSVKQRSYELMRICEGQTVLDLGCGVGIDTLNLAGLVGSSGHVVGVDKDPGMIDEADQRAMQAGLGDRISHRLGEARHLPYPDSHFDACRTERMLMHLADPVGVIAELKRVLKPGGWLVLTEPDWATLSIVSGQDDIERRLVRVHAEQVLANGYAGRQLYPWMRQAGFQDLAVEITPFWDNDLERVRSVIPLDKVEAFSVAEGLLSPEGLETWHSFLRLANEQAGFFFSVSINMVAGRKAAGL